MHTGHLLRNGVCDVTYYYCPECGGIMDSIEALVSVPEVHYELDGKPTEWLTELRCIYCGNDDLEEAVECDQCGEVFPESQISDGLCDNCRAESEVNGNE